jgi:predicted dehydrogenase
MDTTESFRLALVGAGLITQSSHLPAALALTTVQVTAIVDPNVPRAEQLARDYGISPLIAPRVEDVLESIDGAVIATPNHTHCAIAIACLERNIPVLVEKPLAATHEEGLKIMAAAQRAEQVVAVAYSTRFRDEIPLLKSLLESGYFGTVRRFVHQFGTPGGWAPLSAYNLNRSAAGGGVLVVTGTHFLDRMLYLWGYPDEATLEDDSLGGPEANCRATFVYYRPGGRIDGTVRYSKTVKLPPGMVVETDRGYVLLGDGDESGIVFREHGRPSIEQVIRPTGPSPYSKDSSIFQRQIEAFVSAVRQKQRPMVNEVEGTESLRLLKQLYANRRPADTEWYKQHRAQDAG